MKVASAQFMKGIRGTDDILYDGLPQIAFVGRSNVGKSSVINSLLGTKDLVKVGKKPGKTREINFFKINKKFYFVDLPGYGYAKVGPEEKERIRKLMLWYLMYSEVKPLCVALILDIKVGFTDFDREMTEVLRKHGHRYVIVANKMDKLGPDATTRQIALIQKEAGDQEVVPYSAKARKGTDVLFQKLMAA